MNCLIENPQPRDWFFWLGEAAWEGVPPLICLPIEVAVGDMKPGGVTYVADVRHLARDIAHDWIGDFWRSFRHG